MYRLRICISCELMVQWERIRTYMKKFVTIFCFILLALAVNAEVFIDMTNASDADGDGFSDIEEQMFNTDPEDEESVPFLTDFWGITCADINTDDYYRNCAHMKTVVQPTFYDFAKNAACEWFIKERWHENDYGFKKLAPRKEVGGIALKMRRVWVIEESAYSGTYRDIGKGEAAWIEPMVETLRYYEIVSTDRTLFRPDRSIFRAEAYAMIMNSVCMPIEDGSDNWKVNVFQSARDAWLTSKDTYTAFRPTSTILRQELYVIATRAADWAEQTWGCYPKPAECQ